MILTCTSCATRYYADDAAIGAAGRTVRCAACGNEWFAEPPVVLQDGEPTTRARAEALTREKVERMRRAVESPGPAPSAAARYRQQQHERMRRERARAAMVSWAGTGAALVATATGAVVFRQDVAEIWPRSASAFAAVGLDVNVYGLEFYDLAVERAFEGPTPVLLVSGEVRNIGRDEKAPPPIRITLRDAQSNELFEIVHAVDAHGIAAGGGAPFQIRLENPPAEAVDLEASFAGFGEAPTAMGGPAESVVEPADAHSALGLEAPLVLGPDTELDVEGHAISAIDPSDALRGPVDGLAPRFSEPDGRV